MKRIAPLLLALMLWVSALSFYGTGLLRFEMVYASPYASVDADIAYSMIMNGSFPDVVILDVRSQGEYDEGHIYGAVLIPHTELEARIGELANNKNHEVIVYCRTGVRSAIASEILDSNGFTKVYNMLGGIQAWKAEGHPVWVATVHNIDTNLDYDTIQAAVDASQTLDGHSVLVDAGTYHEHVDVHKSISLTGEDRDTTIIDGSGGGMTVKIAADNVSLRGFTIRDGSWGIFITESDFNIISGNSVTANQYGIYLLAACKCNPSSRNTIRNNIISYNEVGIYLDVSDYNTIYHNNFIDNTIHADIGFGEVNTWDDDYPSGGNYWSNSNTIDLHTGSYQNETGKDGLGDTAFVIEGEGNQDHYPLADLYSSLHVHILSPENKTYHTDSIPLTFTVTESTDWIGYSLDLQMNITVDGNTTILDLTYGPHIITVYANDTAGNAGTSETVDFSVDVKQEEPFPTWTVATIVVVVVFGAIAMIYFAKIRKSTESIEH